MSVVPEVVLVADPDLSARGLYAQTCAPDRLRLVVADDGRDALAKAFTHKPSFVFIRNELPHIDGIAVCAILRTDRVTSHARIAVVAPERVAARALDAGADFVLTAPLTPERLRATFAFLRRHGDELRDRSAAAQARARTTIRTSEMLLGRGARAQSRLQKLTTDDPPIPPAPRSCPQCASPLAYQYSYVGGGRERGAEQFDFYECATCGLFEYRPRTQKLRRVI